VLAIALSLTASCAWGVADFSAGLMSRRLSVLTVIVSVQLVGLVASVLLVLAFGDPFPRGDAAAGAVLAGCSGLTGLTIFYRALAIGTMSVVAPIAATGVALPLLVGVVGGDHPAPTQAIGLGATVVGVLLASREPRTAKFAGQRRGAGLAVLAALGFGGYFIGAHVGARGGVPWLLLLSHSVTLPFALAVVLSRRSAMAAPRDLLALIGIGAFDLTATALYGIANRHGSLSIVSVVGSLYPLTTLLLARRFLHERIAQSQALGVTLALGGVALIAAG
jgi:drug/metabolite transporter (DMT)-like permease